MTRAVYGVSDWPECPGEEFLILYAKDGESDEDAMQRAKDEYSPAQQVVVKEIEGGDQHV